MTLEPTLAEAAERLLAGLLDAGGDLVEAVRDRADDLLAGLLREQWMRLTPLLADDAGRVPAWYAWRAGYALHHLDHLEDAWDVLGRAELTDVPGGTHSAPADVARVAAVLASVAWNRGEHERSAEHAARAAALAEESGDASARGWAHVAQALHAAASGDRDGNLRHYRRALRAAEESDDAFTRERVLNNLTSRALEEGSLDEADARAQEGLEANARTGHHSGRAALRHNYAEVLLAQGRLDEALAEAEAARDLYLALESPSAGGVWQVLGDIQAVRGNATQASLAYREALRLAEQVGDAQTVSPALAGLAVTTVGEDPAAALAMTDRLAAEPTTVGDSLVLLASGWVRLRVGDRAAATAYARRAVEEAGRVRDRPRLAEALELAALADPDAPETTGRLREAAEVSAEIGNPIRLAVDALVRAHLTGDTLADRVAREDLRALGVHADAARIAGPLAEVGTGRPAAPVRVHALGAFVVSVDGVPVPATQWPSRKAREVLRVLVAAGERGLTRGALAEAVWPEAAGVENRLSVALSHLRTALDPERRHPADHAVLADRDRVRLAPGTVEIDVHEFLASAEAALAAAAAGDPRAVRLLEAAASLHTGRFLEGEESEEWARSLTDLVEDRSREVTRTLAALLADGDDPASALPWLVRLIAEDPYDEPAHLDAVRLLSGLGRYGEARRFHRAYEARMAELDVPARPWDALVG